MNIKHIFFDLDHTLWDFEKNSSLAFQQIFEEQQINLSVEVFLEVYQPINFNYWKLYREEKTTKEKLKYGRLKDTFSVLNIDVSDDLINEIADAYLQYLPNYNHLFEGTFELLAYLQKKYELHIITNGFEKVQTAKIEKSGLKKYFKHIITSESVGVKKPNPKVFYYALKVAKAQPEESYMIGDNIEADIKGAIDCNIKTIYCNFVNEPIYYKNVISVTSLLEIKQYI